MPRFHTIKREDGRNVPPADSDWITRRWVAMPFLAEALTPPFRAKGPLQSCVRVHFPLEDFETLNWQLAKQNFTFVDMNRSCT